MYVLMYLDCGLASRGPFLVKLRPAYSVKLVFFFSFVFFFLVKLVKRLLFEDTKRIMSPEIRPKSFGTFEKGAPGLNFSDLSITTA